MPIPGIVQPDLLEIEQGLRLRRFDGRFSFALPWYRDEETVLLVDLAALLQIVHSGMVNSLHSEGCHGGTMASGGQNRAYRSSLECSFE